MVRYITILWTIFFTNGCECVDKENFYVNRFCIFKCSMAIFLLTIAKLLDFSKLKNNLNLATSYLGSKGHLIICEEWWLRMQLGILPSMEDKEFSFTCMCLGVLFHPFECFDRSSRDGVTLASTIHKILNRILNHNTWLLPNLIYNVNNPFIELFMKVLRKQCLIVYIFLYLASINSLSFYSTSLSLSYDSAQGVDELWFATTHGVSSFELHLTELWIGGALEDVKFVETNGIDGRNGVCTIKF